MNDLEQLGQLWSDYLHAQRQADRATIESANKEYIEMYHESVNKYNKPISISDRELEKQYRKIIWDKHVLANDLYKQLIDTTEQYWFKQVT